MTRIKLFAQASSLIVAFGLLAGGQAFAQTAASDFTSGYRYDAMHRLTGIILPDPGDVASPVFSAVRTTYDAMGRPTKIEKGALTAWQAQTVAPNAWTGFTVYLTTTTTYDVAGNKLTEVVDDQGATRVQRTDYSYDALQRLDCTALRMVPSATPPSSACTGSTPGANGPDRISQNLYDIADQLLQVRRAVGVSGLEQAYATYSYTPNGKRADIVDANGNHSLQIYDAFDRLMQLQFPSATAASAFNPATPTTALATAGAVNTADYEQYGYDENGNRTSLRKRDAAIIGYEYDYLNRVSGKNLTGGFYPNVLYAYDLLNNLLYSKIRIADFGSTYTYDGFSRRLTATNTNTASVARTLSYQYDANGNRTRITYPDATYFTTDYDGLDRPTVMKESGTTSIVTYAYNSHNQRLGLGRANATTTAYGYDNAERLSSLAQDLASTTSDQTYGFGYTPANQIASVSSSNSAYFWTSFTAGTKTYAPDGLNRYSTVAGASFTYDANGNLTSDGSTTYAYDVENHLTSSTGAHASTLTYDPDGRLWTLGGGTTRFLYDGDALVAEYNSAGVLQRRYVHGPNTDEPLVWYEGSTLTDRRFLHANHQGSVIAVSDGSGAASTINQYDEYGAQGPSNAGRFQYTGQTWISEPELYYYKARMYSPGLGRFMQTDPVGYTDDYNLYAYVGNDPVNKSDPTGLCLEDACVVEGGFVLGVAALSIGAYAAGDCAAKQCVTNAIDQVKGLVQGILRNEAARPADGLPVKEGATVVRPGETGRKDEISHKPGTAEDAHAEFDKSRDPAAPVKDIGRGGRTSVTPSGNGITVRPDTKSGPTVEVTRGNGASRDTDKIRYKDPNENQQ